MISLRHKSREIKRYGYIKHFNAIPLRPTKGCIVDTGHDFSQLDELMPHPIYGWMTWISILNPFAISVDSMLDDGLFDEAYNAARRIFNKKALKNK